MLRLLAFIMAIFLSILSFGTPPLTADANPARGKGVALMGAETDTDWVLAAGALPTPGAMSYFGGIETSYDAYPTLSDPGFVLARTRPLSTFAADVDTAAYANIRRMILNQRAIPADAVRIEEMINAFTYGDPPPTGEATIAVGAQVAVCPWNEAHLLMRVNLKSRVIETEALPPSNLVFLIDTSGSMESPDRLPLVKRSFGLLVEQLTAEDRVSIVTYAGSAEVVLEGVRGDEKARLLAAIDELSAGGGTHGADGIRTAYELAERYVAPGLNSRVLLATDGDFNIGVNSENELTRLIEGKRDNGVFLTVLGYGYGNYKDNKMQALAEHGNGNAAYIDTIHQARQALVTEFGATMVTVAKDVKIQVEFNPETVAEYRLLGYESRRMSSEDFRDDAKDGGEIGAGHSMVALYEIIPADAGRAADSGLLYQRTTTTGSADFATVYLRYKEPASDTAVEIQETVGKSAYTETPNDDFILSAAVAAFAQLLSGSEFAGDADEQMILNMLQPMLSNDMGGKIVEFSTLVRKSGGLYGD
ncbi:MAG: VWA domain-containing protein [Clostridia bacterium]|nr:VWA domain-containing protein [Clostridia bacterium]